MKDINSNSWFSNVRRILHEYGLPSAYDVMENPPSKHQWKSMIDKAVNDYWRNYWKTEMDSKPSLKYLTLQNKPTKEPHPLWKSVQKNTRAVTKTHIKAKLITGTYTLQAHRNKFNQQAVSPTCLLCKQHPEDREHFLLHCSTLKTVREKHLKTLKHLLATAVNPTAANHVFDSSEVLMKCLMDCNHDDVLTILGNISDIVIDIEEISRNLIFELHNLRAVNLMNS